MRPFEEYHHREKRLNELRDEQWRIERDRRRERERRKSEALANWCWILIWIAAFVLAIAMSFPTPTKAEEPKPSTVTVTTIPQPKAVMPEAPVEDFENEKIEAALLEQGYLRDDIPLDYDTQALLRAACDETGVEFELMLALIEVETNFRNVIGDSGDSYGYCQIQPKWWRDLMAEIGANDLMHPRDNFRTGCAILNHLLEKHGDIEAALTAYNTGVPGSSTYADRVLAGAAKWRLA